MQRLALVEARPGDHQLLHPWGGVARTSRSPRPAGSAAQDWPAARSTENGGQVAFVPLDRARTPCGRYGRAGAADGAIDEHADLDLAGRDHLDVDAGLGPGPRTSSWRRRCASSCPRPTTETLATSASWATPDGPDRPATRLGGPAVSARSPESDGKADLGASRRSQRSGRSCPPRCCDRGDRVEERVDDPGRSGHPKIVIPRLILGQGRAGDRSPRADARRLGDDPGPRRVGERAPHMDRHAVLLGELDRARCTHPAPRLASSSISS